MSRTVRRSTMQGAAHGLRKEEPQSPDLRPSFWVAAGLWVASVSMAVWAAPTEPPVLAWLSFATVGALLVWLEPRHPVGWLLMADGLVWIGGAAAHRYVTLAPSTGTSEAVVASSFDLLGWIVAIALIPLTMLLVPTGRFIGRWDRVAAASIVAGGGWRAIVGLITADTLPSDPSFDNPFELSGLQTESIACGNQGKQSSFLG